MTNLKRIRKEKGLTQKQLADISGVNLKMIQKYETGERDINHAQALTVIKLAYALNSTYINLLELDKKDFYRLANLILKGKSY